MRSVVTRTAFALSMGAFLVVTATVRAFVDFDPPSGIATRIAVAFVVLAIWMASASAVVGALAVRVGCVRTPATAEGFAVAVVGTATLLLGGQLTTTYLGTGELTAREIVMSTLTMVVAITVVVGVVDLFRRRQRRRS
jgi:hypothetical protein